MKRFYTVIFAIIFLASAALHLVFRYTIEMATYHFILAIILLALHYVSNYLVALPFPNSGKRIKQSVFHIYNASFFYLISIGYLLIIGSNLFWKKTITLDIISNYLYSVSALIDVVPIDRILLITGTVLLLLILGTLYFFIRPSLIFFEKNVSKLRGHYYKIIAAFFFLITLVWFFKSSLIDFKRRIHYSEEPILIFLFGPMWEATGDDIIFEKKRFDNGLKDKECMQQVPTKTDSNQNFIIILVDGLRKDHLPFYGYKRQTAPFLDSLFKTNSLSIVENAFSTSTNTIGGVAGLFYSKNFNDFGYNGLNIPKYLGRLGYTNYAFLTGFHKEWYGLSALYRTDCDVYYESSMNYNERHQVDDDLRTLEEIKKYKFKNKSFLYIHLLSVHHIGKKHRQFRKFQPDKISLATSKESALINNYDNGILQLDFFIKELFAELRRQNVLSNSTVYILSDHGELFGEDGEWSHGGNIHPKLLEIPLIIYDEKKPAERIQGSTLLDVAPTIATRIGNKKPACWLGNSLLGEKDFTVEITSDSEHVELPFARLFKTDSLYKIDVYNKNKELKRTYTTTGKHWDSKMY